MADSSKQYRILFYLALAFGFVSTGFAWHWKRQLVRGMNAVDVATFSEGREKKYEFTVDAYGFKYKGKTGDRVDEQILMFGIYEKDRLFFMRDYLEKAKIKDAEVLDVGANTGNHSLFLAQFATTVHAFDPFPPVMDRFRENLELNPEIQNIELHEVGLGDEDAELPFDMSEDLGGGSFRVERGLPFDHKLKVVVGDDYLEGKVAGKVALIKIDVEGFEVSVLKGLKETLERDRPLVIVEIAPLPTGSIRTFDELKQLFPKDYEFMVFENVLKGALAGKYSLLPLTSSLINSDLRNKMDAVAYPRERADAVPK